MWDRFSCAKLYRAFVVSSLWVALGSVLPHAAAMPPADSVDVTVGRYDTAGTGANLRETSLTAANVNPSHFGKLFSYELEGFIYSQPLLISGINVGGKTRNVLYVATTNCMVYALDADDPGPGGGLLWQVRLTQGDTFPAPGLHIVPDLVHFGPPADDTIHGNMGILSTPVISRPRNAIYLVSRTMDGNGYRQNLYALDLVTGQNKPGSPIRIEATFVQDHQTYKFDPKMESNRAGLTIAQDKVVIAWAAAPKDVGEYHGWVIAYDADTLARTGVFCTTCGNNAGTAMLEGGIWQAGRPPAVDDHGYVYYLVGNGWSSGFKIQCLSTAIKPSEYFAESLIKLDPANALALKGSWFPADWCDLDNGDYDLGGSGPVFIADGSKRFLVGGGKAGTLYSFNPAALTGPNQSDKVPEFCVMDPNSPKCAADHHIMGGPVYWSRPSRGSRLYVSLENDLVRMFPVVNGVVDSKHVTTGPTMMVGHPAAIMSLSADGEKPGTGILWLNFASPNATDNSGAVFSTKHGRLAAYNAETMTELWNSEQVAARDSLGYFAKFNPPTVVNGKVYMAAFPAPEPYVHVCYCSEDRMQCRSTNCTPIRQAYHALNNMGYLVVYGANPPVNPPVRSFVADVLPAILGPLMDDPAFDIL